VTFSILPILLRTLRAIFRTRLLAVLDALCVEHAAQDVVTDTGKVAHTATADKHNAVLLQVVAFARDIGNDFALVGQTDLGNLTKRSIAGTFDLVFCGTRPLRTSWLIVGISSP
jgi:hypothetical protein